MGRRSENTRRSLYTVRIICEGEKTEPLFFSALCERYRPADPLTDIRTLPYPDSNADDEDVTDIRRGRYRGKKRSVCQPLPSVSGIKGLAPLKWVQYARQLMSEGIDETWAVYDKDEHPAHRKAWEEANRLVDGKRVNIAFTSRSFEYYLLLHFEYIYYVFPRTECMCREGTKRRPVKCGSQRNHPDDCHGHLCINGYARTKGYWNETKTSQSTFPLVQDRLVTGIVNSARLRRQSDADTNLPVYRRNPYTNVDRLVMRLTGWRTVPFGRTFKSAPGRRMFKARQTAKGIYITNIGCGNLMMGYEMLCIYNLKTARKHPVIEKPVVIPEGERAFISLPRLRHNEVVILVAYGTRLVFLPKIAQ